MSGRLGRIEVLPAGESALLVEVGRLEEVLAIDDALRPLVGGPGPWAWVTDVVPAARTLLVLTDAPAGGSVLAELERDIRTRTALGPRAPERVVPEGPVVEGPVVEGHVVEVPVRYSGPDLDEVARLTGLSPGEVVRAHTGSRWRVAFGGFAPGFAYLVGGDPRLVVPRRDSPRPAVPAGSVGLADEFSGIYPRSSPGGWQLIGETDLELWDVHRDPPALLAPGTMVQFVGVDGDLEVSGGDDGGGRDGGDGGDGGDLEAHP